MDLKEQKKPIDLSSFLKKPYIQQWIEDAPSCIRDLINLSPPLHALLNNPIIIYHITLEKIPPTAILSLSPLCQTFLNSALVTNALDRKLIPLTNILQSINRSTEHPITSEHAMSHECASEYAMSYERASVFFEAEIEEQRQIQFLKRCLVNLTTYL